MLNAEDVARGLWQHILADLNVSDDMLDGRQHDCPLCGAKKHWRFDNKEGRGTWFCNKCGAGDGYRLYMHITGEQNFNKAVKKIASDYKGITAKKVAERKSNRETLNKLWKGSTDGTNEITDYLHRRGIVDVPPGIIGRVLRFNQHTPWSSGGVAGYAPAMLARVVNLDGSPATIHRTFLTTDVPVRKMLMPHDGKLNGCCVPLGKSVDNRLGVAEGIETALAASAYFGGTVWATYCAEQLIRFVEPVNIDILSIYGDNDISFTGQAAAYQLAMKVVKRGQAEARVYIPEHEGDDWNDVLLRERPLTCSE